MTHAHKTCEQHGPYGTYIQSYISNIPYIHIHVFGQYIIKNTIEELLTDVTQILELG